MVELLLQECTMCDRDVIEGYDAPGFFEVEARPLHVPFMGVNTTGIDCMFGT